MSSKNIDEYLDMIASHFAHEIEPVLKMKSVTRSPVLLGQYAEAAIRHLVRRVVSPLRVCTGAVIDYPEPQMLNQRDIIIWAPFPAPALFDLEGFGVVPRGSAFGVIEIKRSGYKKGVKGLQEFLMDADEGKIVAYSKKDCGHSLGLGVIPVLEKVPSGNLGALLESGRVVAIYDLSGRAPIVQTEGIHGLINFLARVSAIYTNRAASGTFPQIVKTSRTR